MRGEQFTVGYFDNFHNEPLNKYKKNLKKKFINMFFYLWIDINSNFIEFYYRLIVHQKPLNWNCYKLHENLMVFDILSNDNEIA
jgi:hypothetical protein